MDTAHGHLGPLRTTATFLGALLLSIAASPAIADAQVSGTVKASSTLLPLPGAIVSVRGTAARTMSAADGSFTLAGATGQGLVITAASIGHFTASTLVNAPFSGIEILLESVPADDDPEYDFVPPASCGTCHPDQLAEWTGTPMAKAATNTWVHDLFAGNGTPGGMGAFVYTRDSVHAAEDPESECSSCHQPEAWIAEPFSAMIPPSDPAISALHGVPCDVCHKVASVDVTRINSPGFYPGAAVLTRPAGPEFHQVQYGVLADSDYTSPLWMRSSYQPQLVAELCGLCHQDANDPDGDGDFHEPSSIISEPTYLEWLASPFGDPASPHYATCVDCHMPPSDSPYASPVLVPPLARPAGTIRSHRVLGTTPEYLENAVEMQLAARREWDRVEVDVSILNSLTGHHVPTGVTIRNMILLVEARRGDDGAPLAHLGSQTVHPLGGVGDPAEGYYAGLPGKLFAVLNHAEDGTGPTFFTDATGVQFDTRIPALATDESSYAFAIPAGFTGTVDVSARLVYRRSFRSLVDAKQWTADGHGDPLEDILPPYFGHLMEEAATTVEIAPLPPHQIRLGADSGRDPSVPLADQTVSGGIHVFVLPEAGVQRVRFYLDDPQRSGSPSRTENSAPYDLAGTAADLGAIAFDTATLSDGFHTVTAEVVQLSGGTSVIHAECLVANGLPRLVLGSGVESFSLVTGGSESRSVPLAATDGGAVPVSLESSAPWLTVTAGGTTPLDVTLTVNTSGLSTGDHSATVMATDLGADPRLPGLLSVELTVLAAGGPTHSLRSSTDPSRAPSAELAGSTVAGEIYAFLLPETGVRRVTYWIDDPSMSGIPLQVEKSAPYDLRGGTLAAAQPFDTAADLSDGFHQITTKVERSDGTIVVLQSDFLVVNGPASLAFSPPSLTLTLPSSAIQSTEVELLTTDGAPSEFDLSSDSPWLTATPSQGIAPATITVTVDRSGTAPSIGSDTAHLVVTSPTHAPATLAVAASLPPPAGAGPEIRSSASADRTPASLLDGQAIDGNVFIFVAPEAGVTRVSFHLDDPLAIGAPFRVEKSAPFDLAGGTASAASPFDSTSLADGPHSITAHIDFTGGVQEIRTANFNVANSQPSFTASPGSWFITAGVGELTSADIFIGTSDGSLVEFVAASDAPWLAVSPATGTTPAELQLLVDTTGLATGSHIGAVSVQGTAGATILPISIDVTLVVTGSSSTSIFWSGSPDRSEPAPLSQAILEGDAYIFTSPDEGVSAVRFYIDDPQMTGPYHRRESNPPFDLNGGSIAAATPFDTHDLADGPHSITVALERLVGGAEIVTAEFEARNTVPSLLVSTSLVDASTLVGSDPAPASVAVGATGGAPASFTVSEDASWLEVEPGSGIAPRSLALHFSAAGLAQGSYATTLLLESPGLAPAAVEIRLAVLPRAEWLRGGLLYDRWWTVNGAAEPSGEHPLYPSGGPHAGSETFRCVTCHGWDYEGAEGAYATGPDFTGIAGVLGTTRSDAELIDLLRLDSVPGGHGLGALGLSPQDASDLVSFLRHLAIDTGDSIDASKRFIGDGAEGEQSYESGGAIACTVCHGPNGTQIDLGDPGADHWLGTTATLDPWKFLHRVRVGNPGTPMPSWLAAGGTTQGAADIGRFIQDHFPTGDEVCEPVPCSEILVPLPHVLSFAEDHGGVEDATGIGTGFTTILASTNGAGYIADLLHVATAGSGLLELTTTSGGLSGAGDNAQDDALGVGIDTPSQVTLLSATLVDVPFGTGSYEQAGVWFGESEDDVARIFVNSTPGGPQVRMLLEVDGDQLGSTHSDALQGADLAEIALELRVDPITRKITGSYRVGAGTRIVLGVLSPPDRFFSFDPAEAIPAIGTRNFGGIFASHRNAPSASLPLIYRFDEFSVTAEPLPPQETGISFAAVPFSPSVEMPTSLVVHDGHLFVLELTGRIHDFSLGPDGLATGHTVIDALVDAHGPRLALGIEAGGTPATAGLWVSHSSPGVDHGIINSGVISRLGGAGYSVVEDVVVGLPRSFANHATNSIHFGPDGRLYVVQGGNTGAGAPNTSGSEFGARVEQYLSSALLAIDISGMAGWPIDCFDDYLSDDPEFQPGIPPCASGPNPPVEVFASGLRNTYDFVFHSNGSIYAPDNGLGVTGTFPQSAAAPCFGNAPVATHNPGSQPDPLLRILPGRFYGHPNPSRGECVFGNGSEQGVPPLPHYEPPLAILGDHWSANGIIEYGSASSFCGSLAGDLILAKYSVGDELVRVRLAPDGASITEPPVPIHDGLVDPLGLAQHPSGVIYVGEFGADRVTALVPADPGCWSPRADLPFAILDAAGDQIDGRFYVVAGKTAASGPVHSFLVFDPAAGPDGEWTVLPDRPGTAVENPAVVALGGKLYVFGGSEEYFTGAVAESWVYDPAAGPQGTWSALAPMPTARGGATARVVGDAIYVVGGIDFDHSLAVVEVFHPGAGAGGGWSAAPPMLTRRDNPGSFEHDGILYVVGGRTRDAGVESEPTLASMESFDPATGLWSPEAPMPTGRRTFAVGSIGGRFQVMGGEKTPQNGVFPNNEEYDPFAGTWRILAPMATPRHGAAAATIDGIVYTAGGGTVGGGSYSSVVEAFEGGW